MDFEKVLKNNIFSLRWHTNKSNIDMNCHPYYGLVDNSIKGVCARYCHWNTECHYSSWYRTIQMLNCMSVEMNTMNIAHWYHSIECPRVAKTFNLVIPTSLNNQWNWSLYGWIFCGLRNLIVTVDMVQYAMDIHIKKR